MQLCVEADAGVAGQEVEALWQEYEDGKSPEALMVKDLDKVALMTSCSNAVFLAQHNACDQVQLYLLASILNNKPICVYCWLQLEMILQAQEYEQEQEMNLQDFFDSTEGRFKTPLGQAWAKEIIRRRASKSNKSADTLS